MSLGIVVKGPEGIVLAAESRVTLIATPRDGREFSVNYDNATKLLSFSKPNDAIGVVTYGAAAIKMRTAQSFVTELEAELPEYSKMKVQNFAEQFSQFFIKQWKMHYPDDYQGPDMTFVVGGYNEGEPYGHVFEIKIPSNPNPIEHNPGGFGITWGGQREFVDRLLNGYDFRLKTQLEDKLKLDDESKAALSEILTNFQMPIPLQAMPLQDLVDLAIFFIRTTINAQNLTVGIRGCGGAIDVAIITKAEGLRFIQRKKIKGESNEY